ncbi:MAG: hypothetical protein KDN05_00835, partial [Verrucomicrobiae bacterium]|nr:hypothetical protein [Verrucomicrobiae bacterium]
MKKALTIFALAILAAIGTIRIQNRDWHASNNDTKEAVVAEAIKPDMTQTAIDEEGSHSHTANHRPGECKLFPLELPMEF